MPDNLIKILISDEQALIRDALTTMINVEEDMNVVASVNNINQAYEIMKNNPADVILINIGKNNNSEIKYTKKIKNDYPQTVMIMLSDYDDDDMIVQALSCGISGFLSKKMSGDKIIYGIRDCTYGNHIIPSSIVNRLTSRIMSQYENTKKQVSYVLNELSAREKEIGSLMVRGMTNKQIAQNSYITEGTVKNYVSDIYSKIGINDRTQAIMFLRQMGLR